MELLSWGVIKQVMLTVECERVDVDKMRVVCVQRKCDQYWPSEGEQTYDSGLTVHLLSTNVTAHYTVRMFLVRSPVKTLKKATPRFVIIVMMY